MKSIILFSIIYLSISVSPTYPQGELLNKGSYGAFTSFAYVFSDQATGWLGNIGFSYKGIIDLGIGYGKSSLKKNTELEYLKWGSTQYSLTLHVLKGEIDSIFLGIALSLSFSDITYETDNWVYGTPNWINDELSVEGSFITPALHVVGNVGIGYPGIMQFIGSVGLTLSEVKHSKIRVKDGVISFGIGLNIGLYLSPSILLSASPAVAIVEKDHSFGINFGIVIVTNKL